MENLRVMSFDLDSFVLVKSKAERSKRVIDFMKHYDVDLGMLQGDHNLLFDLLWRNENYEVLYNYYNVLFLNSRLKVVDSFDGIDCGSFVTELSDEKISFYNLKKVKNGSLWEFENMVREFDYVENKVLAGAFKNVGVDDLCRKYKLNNICSEKYDNHILVSNGIDASIVFNNSIDGALVKPMVCDISLKKVR